MLKNSGFRNTKTSKINMSSMADVAFLVVIFFWVATSIPAQKGITMTLPSISKQPALRGCHYRYPSNIMRILVNSQNQILMRDEEIALTEIKEKIIRFINGADKNLQERSKGIISLKGDRGTNFASYLSVLDQIKAAYTSVRAKELGWSEEKMLHFLENKENATQEEIKAYNNAVFLYPEVISEADPTEAEQPLNSQRGL